ncbi:MULTISPECIES: SDR family NAD(P)-dependent oxidoreductase [Prauserella salsuginis group]|uniref:SDR family NAD(P)-dependent oxidoreductase n=1 Tax=Prauserella salsuginis TaxID=387889 RepID=A0ABW6G0Y3_9PSEU|nr:MULTISPECIES: SDR family NAD(P)-dependent oxidoreductase [Prauserella salsuginis group]MCR3721979.1 3-oxoacyl-[acyl-carrier protein] reductase [Prauserella flava]MCR3735985.1 3-oxoacyl-[acyl-carrier protein] reductase [Prauserella salsuginis]
MAEQNTRGAAAITGGAGGLGAEIATRLARQGFSLTLLDLHDEGLRRVEEQLGAAVSETAVLSIALDLTDEDGVAAAFDRIDERFGRLDALVNTAGGSGTDQIRSLDELSADVWRHVVDDNLTSAFLCCKHAVPIMKRAGYGRIVNFSSAVANGKTEPSGAVGTRLPYAASKAAINGLTKQLAKDLGGTGITVNSLSPGLVLPKERRVRDSFEALPAEAQAAARAAIPAGRTGTGAEVAAAVAYLVSEEAGFTTGSVMSVDGAEV